MFPVLYDYRFLPVFCYVAIEKKALCKTFVSISEFLNIDPRSVTNPRNWNK